MPATQTDHTESSRARRTEELCRAAIDSIWEPWWLNPVKCSLCPTPAAVQSDIDLLASIENPVPYRFDHNIHNSYSLFGCQFPGSFTASNFLSGFHKVVSEWIETNGYELVPQMTFEFMLLYTALWEAGVNKNKNITTTGQAEPYITGAFYDLLVAYNFAPWGKDAYRSLITIQNSFDGGFFGSFGYCRTSYPTYNAEYSLEKARHLRYVAGAHERIHQLYDLSEELLKPTEAQQ